MTELDILNQILFVLKDIKNLITYLAYLSTLLSAYMLFMLTWKGVKRK